MRFDEVRVLLRSLFFVLLCCGLTACGGGGGDDGSGQEPVGQEPVDQASIRFVDAPANFSVGQVALLQPSNLWDVNAAEFTATINGRAVPLVWSADQFAVQIPDLPGTATLTVKAGARDFTLPLTIVPTSLPADLPSYIASTLETAEQAIASLVASADDEDRDELEALRVQINEQKGQVSSLSADDQRQLALLIKANGVADLLEVGGTAKAAVFDPERCWEYAKDHPRRVAQVLAPIPIVVLAGAGAGPIGALVAVAAVMAASETLTANIKQILNTCFKQVELAFEETLNPHAARFQLKAALDAPQLSFNSGEPKDYALMVVERIANEAADVPTLSQRVYAAYFSIRQKARDFGINLPSGLLRILDGVLSPERRVAAEASRYRYTASLPDVLQLRSSASGERVTFTAAYLEGKGRAEDTAFTVTVSNVDTGATQEVPARLAGLTMPSAYDGGLDVVGGASIVAQLAGSNAQRFEIVTQPEHGSVQLTNAATGEFRYTSTTGAHGIDRFIFRVINDFGESEPATVTVAVDQTAFLTQAALGNWTVQGMEAGDEPRLMVLLPDVVGEEPVDLDGDGYTDGYIDTRAGYYEVGKNRYDIRWAIYRMNDGSFELYEWGFWHPAFNYLARDPLDYPITSFTTYGADGTPAVRYTKQ